MYSLLNGKDTTSPGNSPAPAPAREWTKAEHLTAMRHLLDVASRDQYRHSLMLLKAARVHAEAAKSAPAEASIHYTADAVVFATDNDTPVVLLIRRSNTSDAYPSCWALPGGYVEPGETSFAAIYRELTEETGLNLYEHGATLQPVGIYDLPDRDPRGRVVSVAFTTILPTALPVHAGDDAAQAEWVPVDKALADTLAFDHNLILENTINATKTNAASTTPAPARTTPRDGDAI